jgi:hypothetical protein
MTIQSAGLNAIAEGFPILHLLVDVVDDGLMQRFLIPLQGQYIVGLAVVR